MDRTEVMSLFAREEQAEVRALRDARDAALEEEQHRREVALGQERDALASTLTSGLFEAAGAVGTGAGGLLGSAPSGQLADGLARAIGAAFKADAAALGSEAKLLALGADRVRHRAEALGDAVREAMRLRDGYTEQLRQSIAEEKRTSERIRG